MWVKEIKEMEKKREREREKIVLKSAPFLEKEVNFSIRPVLRACTARGHQHRRDRDM